MFRYVCANDIRKKRNVVFYGADDFTKKMRVSVDCLYYHAFVPKFPGKSLWVTSSNPGSTTDAMKSKK